MLKYVHLIEIIVFDSVLTVAMLCLNIINILCFIVFDFFIMNEHRTHVRRSEIFIFPFPFYLLTNEIFSLKSCGCKI